MNISLKPIKQNEEILRKLLSLKKDKEIYVVGGAVRDIVLGKNILDIDFALKGSGMAFAEEAARKLKGAFVPLSEKDDEVRVVINKELVLDFKGFTDTLIQDLTARDFTINAIALSLDNVVSSKSFSPIDPFEGLKDIEKKRIKTVSRDSIKNDPLRILRAYRFKSQLGFEISHSLEKEAETTSLKDVARERISYELKIILQAQKTYPIINRLIATGLLEQIFPFPDFFRDYAVRAHSLMVFERLEHILNHKHFPPLINDIIQRINSAPEKRSLLKLTALFHDVSKPETLIKDKDGSMHFYGHDTRGAKKMLWTLSKILRFSNAESEYVEQSIARHMHLHLLATSQELTERAMRRYMRMCGSVAEDVMILDLADGFATAGRTRHLEKTITSILELASQDAKRSEFKPYVNGNDLIEIGLKPGPIFKIILAELEELQWENKIQNKDEGIAHVKERLESGEYTMSAEPADDSLK